jgi:SAM-dependent methyltransferase
LPHTTESPFDVDVRENEGYRYTTNASLSSRLANERLTEATLAEVSLSGKRVVDVGCGDGSYTIELHRRGNPAELLGFDPTARAIEAAKARYDGRPGLSFRACDIDQFAREGTRFDLAIMRGVLHHVDDPARAVASVAALADEVVILEPNGYNPGLKVIEKASRYHREHGERSFTARQVRGWLADAGMRVVSGSYVGLVPFFFPEGLARLLKRIEPGVERVGPLARAACAVYVVHAISARCGDR